MAVSLGVGEASGIEGRVGVDVAVAEGRAGTCVTLSATIVSRAASPG